MGDIVPLFLRRTVLAFSTADSILVPYGFRVWPSPQTCLESWFFVHRAWVEEYVLQLSEPLDLIYEGYEIINLSWFISFILLNVLPGCQTTSITMSQTRTNIFNTTDSGCHREIM